ncbi:caspase family protein [Candidatus Pelagibacter sp.]|nr:caspase family protein [Candidatus Pelagibacter sp.]
MKRLLAYLIVVISLGLTFNVNADAANSYKVKIKEKNSNGIVLSIRGPLAVDKSSKWFHSFNKANQISIKHCDTEKKNTYVFWNDKSGIFARNSRGNLLSWRSYSSDPKYFADGFIQDNDMGNLKDPYRFRYFCAVDKNEAYNIFSSFYKYFKKDYISNIDNNNILYYSQVNTNPYGFMKFIKDSSIQKTQIAKAEPSQTQKVVGETRVNLKFCDARKDNSLMGNDGNYAPIGYAILTSNNDPQNYFNQKIKCLMSFNEFKDRKLNGFKADKFCISDDLQDIIYNVDKSCYIIKKSGNKYYNLKFSKKNNPTDYEFIVDKYPTQIAKAEPSPTQKIAGKKDNKVNIYRARVRADNHWDTFLGVSDENKEQAINNAMNNCKKSNYTKAKNCKLVDTRKDIVINDPLKDTKNSVIAKTEPTIKPKKKVKVAKVEEPKQEEFKPKKTNQDNEAPVITIAEAITVDSQAYTLKGKVKDKSQIYLTIDGRQVDVTKGKFELDRFSINSDATEEIKIVAIDKWNNRSEKIVKVTIDLQSSNVAKVYEQLKPNNIKVKTDNNKIAIIIGIEKYENLTNLDAKYANRDAQAFRTYATRALGIKPSNIKMLIDDKATRSQALKAFKLWLPKIAGKGGKDIHIFFAGHGLASDNGEDLYILPQDGESSLLEDTAISRVELISLINKVNPKSVTMFFDTCYSGQTRDERMLVASLRPIRIVADEQETPDNFTIFTASNYDQTSGSIEEAKHGMFSYYLMKGLEGKADDNKDKKITNGELIAYLKDNVSEEAFTQNREQDPMLSGDPDKVLMSYR